MMHPSLLPRALEPHRIQRLRQGQDPLLEVQVADPRDPMHGQHRLLQGGHRQPLQLSR